MSADPRSDLDIDRMVEQGNALAACPDKVCTYEQWMSPEDPDGSFSDLLAHILLKHPDTDQNPATLWPLIRYREEA